MLQGRIGARKRHGVAVVRGADGDLESGSQATKSNQSVPHWIQTHVILAEVRCDVVADAHAAGPDHVWQLDLEADDEAADEPPTLVVGDDHRLRQVMANLLANARVHTPAGTRIEVGVRREGDDVVVRVRDDGPGIPPDLRERLFERFTRGDASRNHTSGSTGLGLAIANAVVHAHDGTLTCASRPGRTVFTVTLPAAVPSP